VASPRCFSVVLEQMIVDGVMHCVLASRKLLRRLLPRSCELLHGLCPWLGWFRAVCAGC
jgi:hypothetical protein